MGLFDRLFGKKKQEETKHDEPVSEKEVVENTQEPKNEEEIRETTELTEVSPKPVDLENVTDESVSKVIDIESEEVSKEIADEPVSKEKTISSERENVVVTDEKTVL